MKLPAICLMVAAAALATGALWPQEGPHSVRNAEASPPVHITGPAVVEVSDLQASSPSLSGVSAEVPPRIPSPRFGPDGPAPAPNVIDANARIASAPPKAFGFEGLSNSDNLTLVGLDLTPPDAQLAVGPAHIVEFVNSTGRVFDRSGATLQTFTLSSFFSISPGHFGFDPKIVYDARSGRWFATYASRLDREVGTDEGGLYLAVSQSNDPTGQWDVYKTSYDNIFPDQPSLGLTDDKVTISSNMGDVDSLEAEAAKGGAGLTCASFCGEQTIVFQKSGLLEGVPADQLGRFAFPPRLNRFGVRPALSLTATNDQYLAAFSTTSRSRLHVIRITGTPDEGNVTEAELTELTIITQIDPPPSITAGNGNCIVFAHNNGPPPCVDSGDYRMTEAVWRDNKMWLAAPGACRPVGDDTTRSCAHLIEVETEGTPSKTQDIMYGAAGEYYSWPAIRTTGAGDLIVALSHTNPSIFAELRVAGRKADDNPNTMEGSALIKAGETVHTSGRWGDYFGAAVDPEHPNCVWIAGEFAKVTLGRDWSTYLASASYRDDCPAGPPPAATPIATAAGSPAPSATPTDTPTFTPTFTPTNTPTSTPTFTPTPTPTPRPRYGDVDCDINVNSLDAALVLQFSAGLFSSLNCHQNADVNSDGSVNALDAALILQFNAGLIASLPPS
jgi:hypothetical protein